jgi:predicted MPP superfamily phosphohydrolase
MKYLKTIFGLGSLAGGGFLAYAWAGERPQMHVRSYHLSWPNAASLKILHLSDQHFGREHWVQQARLARMKSLFPRFHPDLILLTGDFLHDNDGLSAVERMLQMLPPAPLGIYAVLGNHDYAVYSYGELFRNMARSINEAATPVHKFSALISEAGELSQLALNIYRNDRLRFAAVPNNTDELIRLLSIYNVTLLHNRAMRLPEHPQIWIAGVDDMVEGEPDLEQALADIPEDAGVILLTHNPDLAYDPAARQADLVFSGHTHGGQVVLPRLGAIHTQGTRLPRKHAAGYFNDLPGGGQMIVSRGMGESTPFRFGAPPEIVWVEVE